MEIILGFVLAFMLVVLTVVVLFRGVNQRLEGRHKEMRDKITKLESKVKELEEKGK